MTILPTGVRQRPIHGEGGGKLEAEEGSGILPGRGGYGSSAAQVRRGEESAEQTVAPIRSYLNRTITPWLQSITELVNRELLPVLKAMHGVINERHGFYELVEATGTVADDTEFLRIDATGATVTLPLATIHPGPIYVTSTGWNTIAVDSTETIDGGASLSFTDGVLYNDGASAWFTIAGA